MNFTLDILAAATTAPAQEGDLVGDITRQFGVTWPLFIAQCISFFIVLLVLKKFAFGPIQDMLNQRAKRIEEGEAKLKRIEQQLADSEVRTAEAIAKANEDATRLINEAKESSAALSEQKTQEAIASAQNIIAKAEDAAKAERNTMMTELRGEFGKLVASTTAQVTGKVLTADDQKRINDEALASID